MQVAVTRVPMIGANWVQLGIEGQVVMTPGITEAKATSSGGFTKAPTPIEKMRIPAPFTPATMELNWSRPTLFCPSVSIMKTEVTCLPLVLISDCAVARPQPMHVAPPLWKTAAMALRKEA